MNNVLKLLNSTAYGRFMPRAFDPAKAGWKLKADGTVEMKDGNPVYIDTAGNETTIAGDTISRLNGEARTHREAKETAERELKKFTGIDPAAAREAIETVGKIKDKKLIESGEVDKLRQEIGAAFTTQIAEKDKAINELTDKANNMTRSHAFSSSAFVKNRVAVPADMFERTFANNFKMEDGKMVPYYNDGNKVFSKARFGETADFEEALELIVGTYSHKDSILKAPDHSGSGNSGGGGGNGKGRIVRRAEFDKMAPHEQAAVSQQSMKGEVNLVD